MDESVKGHYARLLGLGSDWRVVGVDLALGQKRVTIRLEHCGGPVACPECGVTCPLHDHAEERTWRHLDTMQFETLLMARSPRCRCAACGVKTLTPSWTERHSRFTLLFEAFAIDVLQASASLKAGAQLLGISWDQTQAILDRAVARGLARREVTDLKHVGLDEKSFGKGQDYVTTLTDLDGARVLEVVPGRTEADANKAWETLTESQREGIQAAAIDMSMAYENSVRANAPNADIVHDRFHVAKLLNESVDQVRRQEQKTLKAEGDDRLTGTRPLWMFAADHLDEERAGRLEELRRGDLKTGRAWAIKEYFRWFWKQEDEESGAEQFHDWYSWAIRSRLPPIKRAARTLKERLPNLLTWFAHHITNALSEGFNSVIQNLKTNARGFRNFDNYRTRILFFCGKLDLKPVESFEG